MKYSVFFLTMTVATGAFAASDTLNVTDAIDDKIEDIETAVADDFALGNDENRFANTQLDQSWKGSLSASFAAFSDSRGVDAIGDGGTTDTTSASIAGRLTKGSGKWNHTFGMAYEFSSSTDTDGDTVDSSDAYLSYEATRDISDNFYVFGLGTAEFTGGVSDSFEGVVAFGPGYRIINNPNTTWRVQAGPSYNYTANNLVDSITGLELDDTIETSNAGVLAASRVWYKISDTASLTNDTEVKWTDAKTSVSNDLGVTFKITDALSTRVGYRVEWEDFSGDDVTSLNYEGATNKFTTAIVYGF